MSNEKYWKRKEEDRQLLRELEIKNLEAIISETPQEDLDKYTVVVGDRTFTLHDMLRDVQEGTEYGELYISMMSKSRVERLRRK